MKTFYFFLNNITIHVVFLEKVKSFLTYLTVYYVFSEYWKCSVQTQGKSRYGVKKFSEDTYKRQNSSDESACMSAVFDETESGYLAFFKYKLLKSHWSYHMVSHYQHQFRIL
jgi:hypothetical protein